MTRERELRTECRELAALDRAEATAENENGDARAPRFASAGGSFLNHSPQSIPWLNNTIPTAKSLIPSNAGEPWWKPCGNWPPTRGSPWRISPGEPWSRFFRRPKRRIPICRHSGRPGKAGTRRNPIPRWAIFRGCGLPGRIPRRLPRRLPAPHPGAVGPHLPRAPLQGPCWAACPSTKACIACSVSSLTWCSMPSLSIVAVASLTPRATRN